MHIRIYLLLTFPACLFLVSCAKEDMPPVITSTQPEAGSVLEAGKIYSIVAQIIDENGLAEIYFGKSKITRFDTPVRHTINEKFVTYAPSGSKIEIEFKATDNTGHTSFSRFSYNVK
jgi:hypothetical protein